MKKIMAIVITAVMLLSLMPATAALADPGNGKGKGANVIDVNGFHYTLNIIGKKADWNGNGNYDSGSTIFVPADSDELSFQAPDGSSLPGVKIDIALGPEYQVVDGNAFDGDNTCAIELPYKHYSVWITVRGKPGYDDPTINSWIYDSDSDIGLLQVGTFTVTRKWKDATDDLLYADLFGQQVYILDLLQEGGVTIGDTTYQIDDYFWQLLSNGTKLIKVRLYPVD